MTAYKSGDYVEINDLDGGRKIVVIAPGGQTYMDALHEDINPVALFDSLEPRRIGSVFDVIGALDEDQARSLMMFAGKHYDLLPDRSLSLVRLIVFFGSLLKEGLSQNEALNGALDKVIDVYSRHLETHRAIARFFNILAKSA